MTITGGGGIGATATPVFTSNVNGSKITGFTLTFIGAGYSTAPSLAISGGTVNSGTTDTAITGNANNFTVAGLTLTATGSGYTGTPTVAFNGSAATVTPTLSSVALGSASSIGGTGDTTINPPLTGAFALTKAGSGTLTLAGANTYSGITTITNGTLLVNGSTASGSAVIVGGAAAAGTPTVGGSGTISGTVNISAAGGGAADRKQRRGIAPDEPKTGEILVERLPPNNTGGKVIPLEIAMRVGEWDVSRNPNSMFDNVTISIRALAIGPFAVDLTLNLDSTEKHAVEFKKGVTSLRSLWSEYATYFSSNGIPDGENWRTTMESPAFASWTAEADHYDFANALNIYNIAEKDWKMTDRNDPTVKYYWKFLNSEWTNKLPGLAAATGKAGSFRFLLMASKTEPTSTPKKFAQHFFLQRLMDQMLNDLNVNRLILSKDKIPSAATDNAQATYLAIASLAYNLIVALGLTHAPQVHDRTVRKTIREVITTPAIVSTSKNYDTIYL